MLLVMRYFALLLLAPLAAGAGAALGLALGQAVDWVLRRVNR